MLNEGLEAIAMVVLVVSGQAEYRVFQRFFCPDRAVDIIY